MSAADQLADQLTAAGADWRNQLPGTAQILHVGDPDRRDSVRYGDDTLYLVEESGRWHVVGWSDASKARLWRPLPVEQPLGGDDDGAEILDEVRAAAAALVDAETRRLRAVTAAKQSRLFTVDEIARAAGMTRDGVYKLLARSRPR